VEPSVCAPGMSEEPVALRPVMLQQRQQVFDLFECGRNFRLKWNWSERMGMMPFTISLLRHPLRPSRQQVATADGSLVGHAMGSQPLVVQFGDLVDFGSALIEPAAVSRGILGEFPQGASIQPTAVADMPDELDCHVFHELLQRPTDRACQP